MRELRSVMQAQQAKLVEVQAEVAEGKFQLQEQKRELQLLKDFVRTYIYYFIYVYTKSYKY